MLGYSYNNNTSSSSINSLPNLNNNTSFNSTRGSSTLMSTSQSESLSPGPFTPMTPSSTQSSMSPGILLPPTKNYDGFQVSWTINIIISHENLMIFIMNWENLLKRIKYHNLFLMHLLYFNSKKYSRHFKL